MKKFNFQSICSFLLVSFYLALFFSLHSSIGGVAQALALAIIGAMAVFLPIFRASFRVRLTPYFFASLAVSLFSITAALISSSIEQAAYAAALCYTFVALSVIAQFITPRTIFSSLPIGGLLALVYIFATSFSQIIESISLDANRWEVRFWPIGMHPNLSGFIFGALSLLYIGDFIRSQGQVRKIADLVGISLCLLLIFASQARGGLLALFLTVVLIYIKEYRNIPSSNRMTSYAVIAICTLFTMYFWAPLTNTVISLLDLNSSSRGVDSGGSGRFELWRQGIHYFIESDVLTLLIGNGFRFSSEENIGFSTESSYITLLIDFGLIGFFAIFSAISVSLYTLNKKSKLQLNLDSFDKRLATSFIIYILIQSIFNRYLFSIGNPISVALFLLLLSTGSMQLQAARNQNLKPKYTAEYVAR